MRMHQFIVKGLACGAMAIAMCLLWSFCGGFFLDEEVLWFGAGLIMQWGALLYFALSNWNEELPKVISLKNVLVTAAGSVISVIFYFATKGSNTDDVVHFLVYLGLAGFEVILNYFPFEPNKSGSVQRGKNIEIEMPYFETSGDYFNFSLFDSVEYEEGKVTLDIKLSELDSFISKVRNMLSLPRPMAEYFTDKLCDDLKKLRKTEITQSGNLQTLKMDTILLRNNFKKLVRIFKDVTDEHLMFIFYIEKK